MKQIMFLGLVFFMLSCGDKHNKNNERVISGEIVKNAKILSSSGVPEIEVLNIKTLGIIDTTLLVMDKFSEPIFNFYGLKSLSFLGAFGNLGDGPNDFLYPWFNNQFIINRDSIYFYISDFQKNNFSKINLSKSLKSNKINVAWSIRLPAELMRGFTDIFISGDTTLKGNYRGSYDKRSGRFFNFGLKDKKLTWSNYFPKLNQNYLTEKYPMLYYSFLGFNSEKNIIASAMHYLNRVEFLDLDFNVLNYLSFEENYGYIPDSENFGTPDSIIFFNACYSGRDYFYALAVNGTTEKYVTNKGMMQLHKFKWSGDLIKTFLLDRVYLGQFVVDERNGVLYAINLGEDKEEFPILKYKL
ncbi:MAG: hypothetical protein JJU34_19185 [Lunatimonas sp.]|uniref:BF3164 family lipoprotein n=1 Tax=Lunatimonas sp. TaxID=2060141 RepID=UPI00263AB34B|nr:BF3164 family lipoprotein [Lunatimonas sp.]MCC5939411.1 hypothetical protein [Lunatimonas sp.]